ncbi:MAG TPA: glucose-6-phosphate dehydrogenase assembly protein OpcA [Candidatus Dormibacteraeota bacterium]
MSAVAEPNVAWHGEGVTIAEVLGALSAIRRKFAQSDAGDDEHPHARNCVMTLVAVAGNSADEARATRASIAIAAHHPHTAIIVCEEVSVSSGRIDASIGTHPLSLGSTVRAQCEVVSLHVRGAAGEHLAALVDPMLLSGVPVYLWWLDTPPFGTQELLDAIRICDALVVDSARFDRPYQNFIGLADLALGAHRKLGVADFQWARLEPWREAIAEFFEPKEHRDYMKGIAEVGIDYVGEGRGNRIAASLLIGWLASALGWKVKRAVGGQGGVLVGHFEMEGGRQIEVAFRSVSKTDMAEGEVSAIRIGGASQGRTFQLTVQREPERAHKLTSEVGPSELRRHHRPGGDDDAGLEVAHRTATRDREVLQRNREALEYTATGDLPGDAARRATLLTRERRLGGSRVLLTMIDIGGAETLRHVQPVDLEDEATLLLKLLSTGAHDPVYMRSLVAAAELIRAL